MSKSNNQNNANTNYSLHFFFFFKYKVFPKFVIKYLNKLLNLLENQIKISTYLGISGTTEGPLV